MKYTLFLALLCLFSCNKAIFEPTQPKIQPKMTYLALGDSYTIGESVAENERFPVQLAATLTKAGTPTDLPTIIAKTGWTTDELKAQINTEKITTNYNLVSLLIGVNNQYRGRNVEQFRVEFLDLLETALHFANNHPKQVFVVSIPDWGVTPFAQGRDGAKIAKAIDAYNAVCKEESTKKGILFVDITPISRQATQDASLIANDGLHPSGKMYGLWVEKIKEILGY
jgi:lysophospholipase L1-like esterase